MSRIVTIDPVTRIEGHALIAGRTPHLGHGLMHYD